VTLSAWRIVKKKRAATAFHGVGSQRAGGRWNTPGVAVVYAAETASLAMLELLVHIKRAELSHAYVIFQIRFPADVVEIVPESKLPKDWAVFPAHAWTRSWGDRWYQENRSVILRMPSVVNPYESNFLLNPSHPAFPRLMIEKPVPVMFDRRLK
jgi:RES domain-containing protein